LRGSRRRGLEGHGCADVGLYRSQFFVRRPEGVDALDLNQRLDLLETIEGAGRARRRERGELRRALACSAGFDPVRNRPA
jgi:hypothetical protein